MFWAIFFKRRFAGRSNSPSWRCLKHVTANFPKIRLLFPPRVVLIAFAFCPHLSRSISKVGLMLCLMFTYLLAVAINMEIKGFFRQARDDAHFCLFPSTHTIWQNINILSKLDLYLLAHLWKDLNLKKLKKLHANWKVSLVFARDGKYHF